MTSKETLQQLRDNDSLIREAMGEWMKEVRRAGDYWKSWRAGWKAALDRAIAIAESEEKAPGARGG